MNIPKNLAKSCLLATVVFWIVLLSDYSFLIDALFSMIVSIIPIGITSSFVILVTVCPIFWFLKKKGESLKNACQKYFPFYVSVSFPICVYGIYSWGFESFSIAFFISAFITTSQSWVWFANEFGL